MAFAMDGRLVSKTSGIRGSFRDLEDAEHFFSVRVGGATRALLFAACLMTSQVFAAESGQGRAPNLVRSQSSSASRTTDDVGRVIDKHKGSIYALYAKALRNQPALQGKVLLSIVIAPDGTVTKCAVASSTLDHPALERQIVERFRSIEFGAKGTKTYSNPEYPLSFFSTSGSPKKQ